MGGETLEQVVREVVEVFKARLSGALSKLV